MRSILIVFLVGLVAGCGDNGSKAARPDANGSDGSNTPVDAAIDGSPDAPPDALQLVGIEGVRTAADTMPGGVSIEVNDVIVTYLKPATGTEDAGFFIQKQAAGPAVFVALDPTAQTPALAVGDTISFTATTVGVTAGLRQITGITALSRSATGFDVSTLATDVSSASDLVSNLSAYESRLIHLTGTIAADFGSAGGGGFVSAQVDTAGVSGNANLKMRIPGTLQTSMDLVNTCALTLTGPMWRFNGQAQPSAFVPSDLSVTSCPAPKVLTAVPSSLTTLVVTFDRNLATGSVMADASQFTFDNGLTASAATVSGRTVTLTTSSQTVDQAYTLTVAGTVTDTYGTALDPAGRTAMFTGYAQTATVVINEVNPNIGGGLDLVELRVTSPGTVKGMTFGQAIGTPVVLATLPNLTVATGDLIVIHLGNNTGATTETTSKTQCANAACYAGAWDVAGGTTGLTFSHRVLWVKNADTTLHDAVPFVLSTTSTPPSAFPADLQAIQAAGFWMPADCGGAPCTYTTTPTAVQVSFDWATVGTTATGNSAQRIGTGKTATDWTVKAQTFGAAN